MDHRWDESTLQDRAGRGERERFGTSRIASDPEVERRDRLAIEARRRAINVSPWAMGEAWYDQRDLFTRNSSIGADGYGVGPSVHPEDGSYAYHREPGHADAHANDHEASIHEREAWPWLNYKEPGDDPYFAHLQHDSGNGEKKGRSHDSWWQQLRHFVSDKIHPEHSASAPATERYSARLELDVETALASRHDLDSSDIKVSVKGRDVTLEGTVIDRRSKHVAEEIVEGVRGVQEVSNRLTIRREDPTDANVAFVLPLAMMGV